MGKETREAESVENDDKRVNKKVKKETSSSSVATRKEGGEPHHDEEMSHPNFRRCTDRLETYIHNWMGQAHGVPSVLPTALPPIDPLPTILDMMIPEVNETSITLTTMTPTLDITAIEAEGTGVAYDEVTLLHASTDPGDYERPGRLQRTLDHLEVIGLLKCCRRLHHRSARTRELRLVHSTEHIDSVDQLEVATLLRKPGESCNVGEDLYANENTSRAARAAAGCAIAAALSVVRGEVRNSFALIRPPGHHAGRDRASGFCFFNNVAVAVRAAQRELKKLQEGGNAAPSPRSSGGPCEPASTAAEPRVLVIDWDVHHCDGTENIFYEDPSVVVVSIHQHGSKRGHILRKNPTVVDNIVELDDLAALMDPIEDVKPELCGGDDSGRNKETDQEVAEGLACGTVPNERSPVKEEEPTGGECKHESSQDDEEKKESSCRRQRKPVDYNKLAEEMANQDDELARIFGVNAEELARFPESGSSGSESDSSTSSESHERAGKLSGDSEGYSYSDEDSSNEPRPFYPSTGHMDRVGGDANPEAKGKNINIPWPTHNMGDLEYLQVVLDVVLPVMREFEPEVVFVSCGFDSAARDLLGSMQVTPSGYYLLVKALAAVCPKLVVVLEGGYNLSNVARCSEAVMRALLESNGSRSKLPRSRMLWCQAEELVQQVRETHGGYWQCLNPNSFDHMCK